MDWNKVVTSMQNLISNNIPIEDEFSGSVEPLVYRVRNNASGYTIYAYQGDARWRYEADSVEEVYDILLNDYTGRYLWLAKHVPAFSTEFVDSFQHNPDPGHATTLDSLHTQLDIQNRFNNLLRAAR